MRYMSNPPGRQIATIAAIEPRAPRSFSPTRTAMFVAFKPGRLWLIESISTNSLSSIQCRLVTRLPRRYGTTPPKLVAPMIRNSRKIWPIETSPTAGTMPEALWTSALAAASLMTLGLVPLQAVNHSSLSHAEGEPRLHVSLESDVKLSGESFLLLGYVFFAVEL